ncbi:MAG: type II toxin-antitoxin system HicB family antitoxin [Clostridiales Family XIII bacterium]|jgi:predicted RNase H-like HicB family nuclease|nr:type II toxin-antitoxin system HicB family antitoxin [Clostridiales Family XIII bacterium]
MKYIYPAVFTAEEKGFSINFPDIESCYTCGDDLLDGHDMAEDVLALTLYDYEVEGRDIPAPTEIRDLDLGANEFVTFIACDTIKYRKLKSSKAVKKTLTIPQWLNEMAAAKGLNFSQILQEALTERLNII